MAKQYTYFLKEACGKDLQDKCDELIDSGGCLIDIIVPTCAIKLPAVRETEGKKNWQNYLIIYSK